jgi:CheY-like chemotaxis protein
MVLACSERNYSLRCLLTAIEPSLAYPLHILKPADRAFHMHGEQLCREVARWLRAVCDVPIVFVTAYSDEDTLERIHEQVPGAPVLSKPVYPEGLADAVAAVTKH